MTQMEAVHHSSVVTYSIVGDLIMQRMPSPTTPPRVDRL